MSAKKHKAKHPLKT